MRARTGNGVGASDQAGQVRTLSSGEDGGTFTEGPVGAVVGPSPTHRKVHLLGGTGLRRFNGRLIPRGAAQSFRTARRIGQDGERDLDALDTKSGEVDAAA